MPMFRLLPTCTLLLFACACATPLTGHEAVAVAFGLVAAWVGFGVLGQRASRAPDGGSQR
jgi:hypothetical protein